MMSYLRSNLPLCGAALCSLLLLSACGSDEPDNGMQPVTTGAISATVTADGSAAAGILVQLFAPGSTTPTTAVATSANGVANFASVEQGSWEVEVEIPEGFDLDTGETARKSVTVVANQTASTSFALVDVFQGETIEANGNLEFSPSALTIDAGTQVRWVNVSTVLHTVTPDGHTEWSSATIADNGDTFIHTFDTPGTYQYFCQPHVGQGMTGTITVN